MNRKDPNPANLSWVSLMAAASVGMYSALIFQIEPSGPIRARVHTQIVMSIGYGHLLATLWRRRGQAQPIGLIRPLTHASGLAFAYALYTHAATLWPSLPLALLAVSAWHTIENDRALRRTSLGATAVAPISPRPRDHAIDAAWTVALSTLAAMAPRVWARVEPTDVIAAFTLHHLMSWLIYVIARARVHGQLARTLRFLAWLHVPMIAACIAATLALMHPARSPGWLAPVAAHLLSPATYLFWSAIHVGHTAWRRRS